MKLALKRPGRTGRTGPSKLRGVLATRRGALAVALLCALAATGILVVAMSQYRNSLSTGAKQDTVLVATAEIQKGTLAEVIASKQLYKVVPVLATQVSAGAIVNAASVSGKVAAVTILPGQQLTSADFATVTVSSVASQLTPTERGIGITLDAEHGVAGVLQPGDQVDIYADFDVALNGSTTLHQVVRLLVPDAEVLKTPVSATGATTTGGTLALAIQSTQVASLAYASDNGKVWVVLRPSGASTPNKDLTTIDTILLGARATVGGTLQSPTVVFQGTVNLAGGQ